MPQRVLAKHPRNKGTKRARLVKHILGKAFGNKTHYFQRKTSEFFLFFDSATAAYNVQDANSVVPTYLNIGTFTNGPFGQTGFISMSITSRLMDVVAASEFGNLFDSYKMLGTKMEVSRLQANEGVGNSARFNSLPEIQHVCDYDDNVILTDTDSAMQYESLRIKRLTENSSFSSTVKPRLAESAFKTSGTTVGFIHRAGPNPWVDAAYADVEHYGHKFIINNLSRPANSDGNTQLLRFVVTHYLAFKTVR